MPISSNVIYKINHTKRIVYMTKEAKLYKNNVIMFCPPWTPPEDSVFTISGEVWCNWLTKAGGLRRLDIPNLTKITIDAVFQKFGVDDKYVVSSGPWEKKQTLDDPYVIVRVKVLDNLIDWRDK